jgi:hypothetical protein
MADISELLQRRGTFTELYVDDEPRPQSRLPKRGYYEADFPNGVPKDLGLFDGEFGFYAQPGDFKVWTNLEDVQVVMLLYWAEQHLPVDSFDPETNRVTSSRKTIFGIRPGDSRYYIKNVFEALHEPGEWYLDQKARRLYYVKI